MDKKAKTDVDPENQEIIEEINLNEKDNIENCSPGECGPVTDCSPTD